MSSFDDRQSSANSGLQIPGLTQQLDPVEQLSFANIPMTPVPSFAGGTTRQLEAQDKAELETGALPVPPPVSSPAVTRQLIFSPSTGVTRELTGTLMTSHTTALRQPVVIRGSGKKSSLGVLPPKSGKRRLRLHLAVVSLLLLISIGTFLTVAPLEQGSAHGFNPFQMVVNMVHGSNNANPNLVAQQATATAFVRQDGYDNTGANTTGNTGVGVPGTGGPGRFAYGQCTDWANTRYHQVSGYWVPWSGNADQWAAGASLYKSSGWVVSASPHVYSIIVLQPYVQGAGGFGHVAVVERINSDGSVYASNYNWYANGGWHILSYWTFKPGPGVSFVWHV